MNLTSEQFAILAHVVLDPQGWADHAAATLREEAVEAKVDKYRAEYVAVKDQPGYKTRAEREANEGLSVPIQAVGN